MLTITTNRKDSFTAMKTEPLGNNALVEIVSISSASSVSTVNNDNELQNSGVLRSYAVMGFHLTASAALRFTDTDLVTIDSALKSMVGKVVRWEQFAEGGQTFTEGGKEYALIPWWRLISVEV